MQRRGRERHNADAMAVEREDVRTARQLGQYRLEEPLGAGAMGTVYRATDTQAGDTYAVKENINTSATAIRQFEREAKMLSNLRHSLPHSSIIFQ